MNDPPSLEVLFLHAAAHGDARQVRLLLPVVDVNHRDQFGSTALLWACSAGRLEVVRALLESPNLDVNLAYADGLSPAALLCNCGTLHIFRLLLARPELDLEAGSLLAPTPLWYACSSGSIMIVQEMIAHGRGLRLDVMCRNPHEDLAPSTPLRIAAHFYHHALVELLESYSLDPLRARHSARLALFYPDARACDLFALAIFNADSYCALPRRSPKKARRFFSVVRRLPMELVKTAALRLFGLSQDDITVSDAEGAFRDLSHWFTLR